MTRMHTNYFILTLFILATFSTYGQVKKKESKRDTTKHWEVATDLLWLMDKNQLPPINLQVKRYYKANSAVRLRIGAEHNSNDSSYNSMGWPGPPYESRTFTGFVRAGWESESKLKGKLSFFKGLDLGFWYEHEIINRTRYWLEVDTYIRYSDIKRSFSYELLPFIGFKYYLNDFLSVSFESSIRIFYQYDKYSLDGKELPGYPSVAVGNYENINHKNGIVIIPFQFLNLNIKLK